MRTFTVSVVAIVFAFTFFLVAAPAASAVTVYFSSPTSSTVGTSFSLRANATSGYPITGWSVYVDGNKAWGTPGPTGSISTTINVGAGSHSLYVTAWDSSGASGSKAMTITASGASGTPSSGGGSSPGAGLPTPPSNATVFSNIDNNTFNACSAGCAGGQSTGNYWQGGWQSSPSLDGSSRVFFNGGNAWANVLWYKEFGGYAWATHYLWDFWVRFDSGIWDLHTAEFDLYSANHGIELMAGSQCNFGAGVWDTWNQAAGRWIHTGVPCRRFSPGSWHHIQWYVTRPSNSQYKYNTLVVDGTPYGINQTFYGSSNGWGDKVGVQYQLDLGPNGVDNKIWVDKVKLTIW
jgi:hypothetical protein